MHSTRASRAELQAAEDALRRALAVKRRSLPPGHPRLAHTYFRLAEARRARDRADPEAGLDTTKFDNHDRAFFVNAREP